MASKVFEFKGFPFSFLRKLGRRWLVFITASDTKELPPLIVLLKPDTAGPFITIKSAQVLKLAALLAPEISKDTLYMGVMDCCC